MHEECLGLTQRRGTSKFDVGKINFAKPSGGAIKQILYKEKYFLKLQIFILKNAKIFNLTNIIKYT